ncbi:integrase core domain-containing protein [Orrella daihaiensis]|uniref:Transposase n=1 Tax=Orrella daihaiensis TaxID=2782176 RepID=A0ABY4AJH2_9BURK|nr:integrase core domain-containing protein [Orrella daihaiensis]UOD50427.1 transposase [Orrella daihaiensis]
MLWARVLMHLTTSVNEEVLTQNQMLTLQVQELKRLLGGRLRYSVSFKMQMARLGRKLTAAALERACIAIRPNTVLGWFSKLVKQKYDHSEKRQPGRPRIRAEVEQLIVRLAIENPRWGPKRIVGMLDHLGIKVCTQTVVNVLKRHGIRPGPAPGKGRGMTWNEFIAVHKALIVATDFFTAEVLTLRGLVTYYVLFFIDLDTRIVRIAGITRNPNEMWMVRMARNLTMDDEPLFIGKKYLIHDGDTKFCEQYKRILRDAGIKCKKTLPYCPDMNAYAERWIRSIRSECLDHVILLGEGSLRRAVSQYVEHYNAERPHQGMDNQVLSAQDNRESVDQDQHQNTQAAANKDIAGLVIERKERLGGLLATYKRKQ